MKRKITDRFTEWKNNPKKKPLVVTGARQTGKTTSITEFGRDQYDNFIYVDFIQRPDLKQAFRGSLAFNDIFKSLSALLHLERKEGSTLLFLDEIQQCDEAITALKYMNSIDTSVDVIAAGSLLGVHIVRNGSFPVGYVEMIEMYSMDFEEFAWAINEESAFSLVRECAENMGFCSMHDRMMDLYREYLLVGGMPEVVKTYCNTHSFVSVRDVQNNIHTAYLADMSKYIEGVDASKVAECWDSIPSQLAKESGSTKFMWKNVKSGAKAERYQSSVDWLVSAGLLNRCTQISDGISPLKSFESPSSFKLYVADTGLLACKYEASMSDIEAKDSRSARFRGGIAENYVMQQLVSSGFKPYYWGLQSKQEVEFVVKLDDQIVPIEVKSSKNTRSTSVKYFAEKYNCKKILKVTGKNFGKFDNIINIPLYAACLIQNL